MTERGSLVEIPAARLPARGVEPLWDPAVTAAAVAAQAERCEQGDHIEVAAQSPCPFRAADSAVPARRWTRYCPYCLTVLDSPGQTLPYRPSQAGNGMEW